MPGSRIVDEENAVTRKRDLRLCGGMAMALGALMLLPGTSQAKGGHSHSRSQARAAATQDPVAQTLAAGTTSSNAGTSSRSSHPKAGGTTATAPAQRAAPAPSSVIGTPAQRQQPLAPLSSPVTTTTLTAGGSSRTDSATPSSTSPSESAQSIAGGGGKTLQSCIDFWDPQTHMSKAEWKGACSRSQHRLENLNVQSIGLRPPGR